LYYIVDIKKNPEKYLRQPSIDFDHCNISSSCDVVYKGRSLTQAGYWFILQFCEHFTCLSSKIQNAIKLENISNLITSPSSYQYICRKTRLVHFVIHGRHISMECIWYVCVLGIPKCKFSKQMKKKWIFFYVNNIIQAFFFIDIYFFISYLTIIVDY
jgi:hypothetical protein